MNSVLQIVDLIRFTIAELDDKSMTIQVHWHGVLDGDTIRASRSISLDTNILFTFYSRFKLHRQQCDFNLTLSNSFNTTSVKVAFTTQTKTIAQLSNATRFIHWMKQSHRMAKTSDSNALHTNQKTKCQRLINPVIPYADMADQDQKSVLTTTS